MDLYLSHLKLGEVPLIAGVLVDIDVFTIDAESLAPADVIELRIDMFDDVSPDNVERVFRTARERLRKPIVATVRDPREGGQREIADRPGLYNIVIPLSDAIDVEINAEDTLLAAKSFLRNHKTLLIGSYHNFVETPDDTFLEGILSKGTHLGVDIIKIAAMAHTRQDLTTLLLFTHKHKDKGLITMSMGDAGLPSRIFSPLFGSLLTYGYINRPSAPGQLSVSELMQIFRQLKVR